MTTTDFQAALLRPAVLQILRAAGFSYSKPAVVDTLSDLAARYLLLLASCTTKNSSATHNGPTPTIQDVRLALAEVGALMPQMKPSEEVTQGMEEISGELVPFEDMRGVRAFVAWAQGPVNKEIRRIAGLGEEIDVNEIAAGVDGTEDYLTALKKKHSKTGEESRYQGTALGKENDLQPVIIAGGPTTRLSDWGATASSALSPSTLGPSPMSSAISTAPPTPADFELTPI